jgi:hypothetical protein
LEGTNNEQGHQVHMFEEDEQVVAEQSIRRLDRHTVIVRISENPSEQFWRVDVTDPGGLREPMTTTLAPGASFMMSLIEDAVGGDEVAWQHLAEWGHTSLLRRSA